MHRWELRPGDASLLYDVERFDDSDVTRCPVTSFKHVGSAVSCDVLNKNTSLLKRPFYNVMSCMFKKNLNSNASGGV